MSCTHTNSLWSGIIRTCPICGWTYPKNVPDQWLEKRKEIEEERRSSAVEEYWKEKQGDEYGSY